MLCIEEVGCQYSGEGLQRFLRSGGKDRVHAALRVNDTKATVGCSKEYALSVLVLGDPDRNEWLE